MTHNDAPQFRDVNSRDYYLNILFNYYFLNIPTKAPLVDFLTSGGSNSVMCNAWLRPRAYDLALRRHLGVKKSAT